MKALVLVAVLAATAHADRRAIPMLEDLTGAMQYEVTYGFEPARCVGLLARLRELKVPRSTTIKLARPTRFLANGRHTLDAVERACHALQYEARVERVRVQIRDTVANGGPGACAWVWPIARRAGVKASEPFDEEIVVRGKPVRVAGSLAQIVHKYCLEPHAIAVARKAAREKARMAPYRRRLRNDKLAIFGNGSEEVILRGGRVSADPARLAAARVWFRERSRYKDTCADGRARTTVMRYTFDAAHRVVTHSFHVYCGGSVFE